MILLLGIFILSLACLSLTLGIIVDRFCLSIFYTSIQVFASMISFILFLFGTIVSVIGCLSLLDRYFK